MRRGWWLRIWPSHLVRFTTLAARLERATGQTPASRLLGHRRNGALRDDVMFGWQRHRRPLHQPALRLVEGLAAMKQESVVPHHDVADLPAVPVDETLLGAELREVRDQGLGILMIHSDNI